MHLFKPNNLKNFSKLNNSMKKNQRKQNLTIWNMKKKVFTEKRIKMLKHKIKINNYLNIILPKTKKIRDL